MTAERKLTYRDAIREGMALEMDRDPSVFIMGEDLSGGLGGKIRDKGGGVFRVTRGLLPKFGEERVRDTPISESAFVGAGVGAAITGMRPIIEIMHIDFIGVCMDQIMNQAAKIRYMFGGQAHVPMVIRTTIGAGCNAAAQHSQNLYSMLVHIPGLKVVLPATPYDAKGLMIAAIRDNDPVIYVENKMLYGEEGPVPDEEYIVPLGKGKVVKEGKDLTVVALSRMLYFALEAAEILENKGVSLEVIDPRSLFPLDEEILINSVTKTGRLVIMDEDTPRCSMASEIATIITENCFDALDAPIKRICAPHTPVPFSPELEKYYVPDAERLISVVEKMF